MTKDRRGAVVPTPKKLTPIKAIRAKCLDCSGGNNAEVKFCEIDACSLWPYRMGKRPKKDGQTPTRPMVLAQESPL